MAKQTIALGELLNRLTVEGDLYEKLEDNAVRCYACGQARQEFRRDHATAANLVHLVSGPPPENVLSGQVENRIGCLWDHVRIEGQRLRLPWDRVRTRLSAGTHKTYNFMSI